MINTPTVSGEPGQAPAVVTPYAVRAGLDTGELVEVVHNLDLERPFTAIWRRDRPLDGPAAALLRIAYRAAGGTSLG